MLQLLNKRNLFFLFETLKIFLKVGKNILWRKANILPEPDLMVLVVDLGNLRKSFEDITKDITKVWSEGAGGNISNYF